MRISNTLIALKCSLRSIAAPLAAVSALVACGPSPELAQTPDSCAWRRTYVENYVEAESPPPPAPPALPVDNPFASTRTWVGEYDCPQGITDMKLRISSVRGDRVDAIYEFHHGPSGASGRYHTSGIFDPSTRVVTFSPGEWIERPSGYVTVGMQGRVSNDNVHFNGRIAHERCGRFALRAASD
jgi:hypothetical protein